MDRNIIKAVLWVVLAFGTVALIAIYNNVESNWQYIGVLGFFIMGYVYSKYVDKLEWFKQGNGEK